MNRKPKAERREFIVRVPVTVAEQAAWKQVAKRQDRSLADWIRSLVNAARQETR